MEIVEVNVHCSSCESYTLCHEIETRHKDELVRFKGNWRPIEFEGRKVGTPIRRCSIAIVKKHIAYFKNSHMLEIGCGPLSEIDYSFCKKNNIRYVGLDPERLPLLKLSKVRYLNRLSTIVYSKLKLKRWFLWNDHQKYIRDSFPSKLLKRDSFNLIYGNSTIEHWHENQEDSQEAITLYKKDIQSAYETLKVGGVLIINCPIFVHGNPLFVHGKIELIKKIFQQEWKSIKFEYWGKDRDDLMPYCPEARKKYFYDAFKIELKNMWLLNIVAMK